MQEQTVWTQKETTRERLGPEPIRKVGHWEPVPVDARVPRGLASMFCRCITESESLSELESMDPQKRELLEARIMRKASVAWVGMSL